MGWPVKKDTGPFVRWRQKACGRGAGEETACEVDGDPQEEAGVADAHAAVIACVSKQVRLLSPLYIGVQSQEMHYWEPTVLSYHITPSEVKGIKKKTRQISNGLRALYSLPTSAYFRICTSETPMRGRDSLRLHPPPASPSLLLNPCSQLRFKARSHTHTHMY